MARQVRFSVVVLAREEEAVCFESTFPVLLNNALLQRFLKFAAFIAQEINVIIRVNLRHDHRQWLAQRAAETRAGWVLF